MARSEKHASENTDLERAGGAALDDVRRARRDADLLHRTHFAIVELDQAVLASTPDALEGHNAPGASPTSLALRAFSLISIATVAVGSGGRPDRMQDVDRARVGLDGAGEIGGTILEHIDVAVPGADLRVGVAVNKGGGSAGYNG